MRPSRASDLKSRAQQLAPQLSRWRRHFHMYPEPSMKEFDTAAYVVSQLQALGVEDIKTGVGQTGVVALIRGQGRKTVGLRADMDALELSEQNDVPYRSRRPGLMHACGHDGHTAGLLGVAAVLQQLRDQLPGNVKLIFQPGEEGAGGAAKMIADGVLEKPSLAGIAALHVDTENPAGTIAISRGLLCAQVDDIYLSILGKSAHAARPDEGVDAISVTAQALIAMQQFIARHTNAVDRKLLTIGAIQGGTRHNILADEVKLIGTIRTLEPEGRAKILHFLKHDLRRLVGAMGGRVKLRIEESYPPVINDDRVVDLCQAAGAEIVGKDKVLRRPLPVLGGEDFAYFGQAGIPSAMFELGIRDEKKGFTSPGHSVTFDFDDRRVLPLGTAMLCEVAWRMLEEL